MLFIRQGATHKVVIGPVVAVANGYVPVTTLSVATADEAKAILHDNGTVVDISGYTFAAITTADGYYHLTLQSGISGTVGHMTVVINDDSLCLPVKADFTVIDTVAYDALFADAATGAFTGVALAADQAVNVTKWLGTTVATPTVAGVPEVDTTHWNGTAVTTPPSVNATQISGSTAAADALEESTEAIAYGTVDGTGATTTSFVTSALTPDSSVNDQFNGRVLIFKNDTTTAALRGQATTISDWAHTSAEIGTFTVVALTTAPSTGDTFVIV